MSSSLSTYHGNSRWLSSSVCWCARVWGLPGLPLERLRTFNTSAASPVLWPPMSLPELPKTRRRPSLVCICLSPSLSLVIFELFFCVEWPVSAINLPPASSLNLLCFHDRVCVWGLDFRIYQRVILWILLCPEQTHRC